MSTLPIISRPEDSEGRAWLIWLVRLRWVAILGQVLTLSFSFGILYHPAIVFPLLFVSACLVVVNIFAHRRANDDAPVEDPTLLLQLGIDITALTAFFVLCGGPDNPFTLLYLIHVAMGAVMLGARQATALICGVLACYAALHLFHLPLYLQNHVIPEETLFRMGQVTAMLITSASIGVFIVGLAATLRRRKQHLLRAQARTAQTDRLRSVGTLAAGAAHELNTPLSTIGLRLRRVARRHPDSDTVGDLKVMKEQLDRCKSIVERLLVGAGDPTASGMERLDLGDVVQGALRLWRKESTIEVVLTAQEPVYVELPRVSFEQGLINLLENAREAQAEIGQDAPIQISVRQEGDIAVLSVIDCGVGLATDPERIGDPFYTTKPKGTGLGVFVARAVAVGAGGGLDYLWKPGRTEARFWVPTARRKNDSRISEAQDVGGGR